MLTPDSFHELEIEDPEMLDFQAHADMAVMSLYKLIGAATEHMIGIEPSKIHMVFVRLPIEVAL